MDDWLRSRLDRLSHWEALLHRYAAESQRAAPENASGQGWSERVVTLPDLDEAELVRMHGELIALGLLTVEICDRTVGLRYRLSPEGKQLLGSIGEAGHDEPPD